MDGRLAIETRTVALKRVLVALVAMAGLDAPADTPLPNGARKTLPRHWRNAVLRLLRPAEAAARRLIIALSSGLHVTLGAARSTRSNAAPALVRNGVGTGIVWPAGSRPQAPANGPHTLALPICDPLKNPFGPFRAFVPAHRAPRIGAPGVTPWRALPPPPSPQDAIDATRLRRRLVALGAALNDLPRAAMRFARWQARTARAWASGQGRLRLPLRPGPPPGSRTASRHEVHDILAHAHDLAVWVLERPG